MRATATSSAATSRPKQDVVVALGSEPCCKQPDGFVLCPLGVQFYSKRPLRDCALLELDVAIPGRGKSCKTVSCTGAVVRCEKERSNDMYRVWIKFLDLDKKHADKIKCCSKNGGHLCCFCENF